MESVEAGWPAAADLSGAGQAADTEPDFDDVAPGAGEVARLRARIAELEKKLEAAGPAGT
jgi:hypothetical protein